MKLFSHRLNGLTRRPFGTDGIERALKLGFDAVEIDTRVTSDGVPVLYHDRWVLDNTGTWRAIDEMSLADFSASVRGSQTLDAFVTQWAALAGDRLQLLIDLKTPKRVAEQINTIDLAGLLETTRFLSWHPTILDQLEVSSRVRLLGFSWFAITDSFVREVCFGAIRKPVIAQGMGLGIRPFAPELSFDLRTAHICRMSDDIERRWPDLADVATVSNPLVPTNLLRRLGQKGALACVPLRWISSAAVKSLQSIGLEVAGFSAATPREFQRAKRLELDAVFIDEPGLVRR